MAKKKYDGPLNRHMDFTHAGPNGEPASGKAVQRYIKEIDSKKVGIGYTDNLTHYMFADEEDMNTFKADPSRTDLIVDRIQLEAEYAMLIDLESAQYTAVFEGTSGVTLDFSFRTVNKSQVVYPEPVTVTYTITRGTSIQTVTKNYAQGETVSFLLDDYLLVGENYVDFTVKGQITLVEAAMRVTYRVVELHVEDHMNIAQVIDSREPNAALQIMYSVSGNESRKIAWYLDGVEHSVDNVETSDLRPKFINVEGLAQGLHTLQFRAAIFVNGEWFYTNVFYREFFITTGILTGDPLVSLATEFPADVDIVGTGESPTLYGVQYENFDLRIGAWDPSGITPNTVNVVLGASTIASISCARGVEEDVQLMFNTTGEQDISFVIRGTSRDIDLDVDTTGMNIREITDNLVLEFNGKGRSNTPSPDIDEWTDGVHHAQLTGFEWTPASGWVDGKLLIPSGAHIDFTDYEPLGTEPSVRGFTFEMEFRVQDVHDDDAVLLNLMDDQTGAGIKITATQVFIQSRQGALLSRRFKNDEDLRVSFVINPKTGSATSRLMYVYFNGILSMAKEFGPTDGFECDKNLSVGGVGAGIFLKQIRVYDMVLGSDSIVNNMILYRDTTEEMLAMYAKNDLYETGSSTFDLNKIASYLPVLIITGDISDIERAISTDTTVYVDIDYTNLQDPTRSFRMTHATLRPQGTSSLSYPRKNLRIYSKKSSETVLYDYLGNVVQDGLYSFKQKAQRVKCWTLKADFAESSGAHNTGVARIWNTVMTEATIDGEYKLRTEAQKSAIASHYPYDVRTTIDGFPIVVFQHNEPDAPLRFLGKYNFNNDKSSESVFGFEDIPGFDDDNVQCWEFRDSGYDLALFRTPNNRTYEQEFDYYAADYDKRFSKVWEARYPDADDETPNPAPLKRVAMWINSTEGAAVIDNNPSSPTYGKIIRGNADKFAEWQNNKSQYFDLPKLAAYYVYLMRFGAVDQTVKNAMITTEDGLHWYFINYDNDTILGVRNDGVLMYDPYIDRQTLDEELSRPGEPVYAYAGHESVLWNNFEADDECMELVRKIDTALYTAGLKYADMIRMFNVEQSGKWAEKVYNQDAMYKYIEPYIGGTTSYLGALQGSRSDHRKWWISTRFALYDALYANGAYNDNAVFVLLPNAPAGTSFRITAGKDFYYGWGENSGPVETGVFLEEDEVHTFSIDRDFQIGTPVRMFAPQYLKSIDMSPAMAYVGKNCNLTAAYSATLGTRLNSLILGVDDYRIDQRRNAVLDTISGLENLAALELINISGYTAMRLLDLSGVRNLRTLRAFASGLTSVTFANGAPVTTLELPSTMQSIVLEGLTILESSGLKTEDNFASVNHIYIKNCQALASDMDFFLDWMDAQQTESFQNYYLEVDNIGWTCSNIDGLLQLGQIQEDGGHLVLKGVVTITNRLTPEQVDQLAAIYGNVFEKGHELWISAPPAIYLSGPDNMLEGVNGNYTGIVFDPLEDGGTKVFSLTTPQTGVSVNQTSSTTCELITTEGGYNGDVTLQYTYTPSYTYIPQIITKTITIEARTYPTFAHSSIAGPERIEGDTQYSFSTTDTYNGTLSFAWTLSSSFDGYAELQDTGGINCIIHPLSEPETPVTGTLTCAITWPGGGFSVTSTTLTLMDESICMTDLTNPQAFSRLNAAGLTDTSTVLTKQTAATITYADLKTTESGHDYSILANATYTSLDEFGDFYSVTTVGNYMFYNCSRMTSIVLPANVTSIGDYAFRGCNMLASINIPNNVVSIGSDNFAYSKLVSVEIPDSVTTIGNSSFSYCGSLESISIGSGLTSLHSTVFSNSSSKLSSIYVSPGNQSFYGGGNNCLVQRSNNYLLLGSSTTVIPSTVEMIGNSAFNGNTSLLSITIPNSVVNIFAYAFQGTRISSIDIPDSVTTIGGMAFANCINLTSVSIGSGLSIDQDAFKSVFYNSQFITSITVSQNNINYYDGGGNCIIDRTNNALVMGCSTTVIPNSVTSIWQNAFKEFYTVTSITIPSSVTTIGANAFYATGLTSIDLPDSVISIGGSAFGSCSSMITFNSGNGITSVPANCLSYCTHLSTVVLGTDISSIESYAFRSCERLSTVTIYAVTPPQLDVLAFYLCSSLAHIYVPAESVTAYQTATNWSSYANIIEAIPSGIFIAYTDGTRSNYDTLDSGKTPIGVAVIDSDVSFVIHPSQIGYAGNYYSNDTSTIISGVESVGNNSGTVSAFSGRTNTVNAIASGLAGPLFTSAANAVYADGRTGYLPSIGQLIKIYSNATNINTALQLIGGDLISENYGSSTQKNAGYYWRGSQSSPYYVTNNISKDSTSYGRSIADYAL